jgi:hypothetical protein
MAVDRRRPPAAAVAGDVSPGAGSRTDGAAEVGRDDPEGPGQAPPLKIRVTLA